MPARATLLRVFWLFFPLVVLIVAFFRNYPVATLAWLIGFWALGVYSGARAFGLHGREQHRPAP